MKSTSITAAAALMIAGLGVSAAQACAPQSDCGIVIDSGYNAGAGSCAWVEIFSNQSKRLVTYGVPTLDPTAPLLLSVAVKGGPLTVKPGTQVLNCDNSPLSIVHANNDPANQ